MMMSDLRCPMCGKTNSGDLDYCKYCQARLKPLIANPDQSETLPEPGSMQAGESDTSLDQPIGSGSDLPAWLQSLRSDTPEETGSETLPQWLADTGAPEAEATPEEEIPDWLRTLRGESSKGEEQLFDNEDATSIPAQEDAPDWLAGMREPSSEGLEEQVTGEEQPAQAGEAEQEWLQRIDLQPLAGTASQGQESIPLEVAGLAEPVTAGESQDQSVVSTPEEDSDSAPEWLAGLSVAALSSDALGAPEEPSTTNEPPPAAEEISAADIIKPVVIGGAVKAFVQDEPARVEEERNPNWLDEQAVTSPEPGVAVGETEVQAGDIPDWLTGYDETAIPGESALSTPVGDEEPLNLDWLEEERQTLNSSAAQGLPGTELPEEVISPFESGIDDQLFFSGELPEWLGEDAEKAMLAEAVVAPGEKSGDLAQADLPS
jgi:hypothetical protein